MSLQWTRLLWREPIDDVPTLFELADFKWQLAQIGRDVDAPRSEESMELLFKAGVTCFYMLQDAGCKLQVTSCE